MSVGKICVRSVVFAEPQQTVDAAARRMAEHGVGALVVTEQLRPVGIVTDRDVAVHCVARGRDPQQTRVAEIMSAPPVCVPESTPIESALSRMAAAHVRRLVVVDDQEHLVGLLAMDDVLELLVEEVESIGRIVAAVTGPPALRDRE